MATSPKKKPAAPQAKPAAKATKPAPKKVAPKLSKEQLAAQKAKALLEQQKADAAELHNTVGVVDIDKSEIITDYSTLRVALIEAMGDYANEALGDEQAVIDYTRNGHTHLHSIHPLDLHVLEGSDKINPRNFDTPDMVERVAELTQMVVHGVHTPVRYFVHNGQLAIKGGETRWRAVAHAWILVKKGILPEAPQTLPALLERSGINNANRMLDVVIDNASKALNPIEIAENMMKAVELGLLEDDVASRLGKKVQYVRTHIQMLSMPQRVLNEIRTGALAANTAWKWWEDSGKNEKVMLDRVFDAQRVALFSGANRVMPKHDQTAQKRSGRGTPGSAAPTSPGGASSKKRNPADADNKLIQNFDTVSSVWNSAEWRPTGDGFVTLNIGIPVEDWFRVAHLFGTELTEQLKALADKGEKKAA